MHALTQLFEPLTKAFSARKAKATQPLAELAAARDDYAAKQKRYSATLDPSDLEAMANAKRRVQNLEIAAAVIENNGGADRMAEEELKTPAAFDALIAAYNHRIKTAQKELVRARKKLGELRAKMTEEGVYFAEIEFNAVVRAWRQHAEQMENVISFANQGITYCRDRGVNREPRSFASLHGEATAPLPQMPTQG